MTTIAANAAKQPVYGLGALIVMGGMFWVMSTMLKNPVEVVIAPTHKIVFTPLIEPVPPIIKDRGRKPPPTKVPPEPTWTKDTGGTVEEPKVGWAPPPVDQPKVETRGYGVDSDVMPLVRIEPQYPSNAARSNIEGWVQLRFTITAAGTVRDPIVVDASPKGYFEAAALNAVSRWKYQPKVHDGRVVERTGVQVLMRFDLKSD
jgi:protein TonB